MKHLIHEIHRRSLCQVSMTIRSRPLLACACVLAIAGFGCSRGNDRTTSDRSTLTVLYPFDERILGAEGRGFYSPAQFLVFLPLVTRSAEGELEPRLARSWEHSVDHRTWRVHLRTDVRWHDGVPVTAHDVKFTMNLLLHPGVLVETPGAYTLKVVDDSTFTVTYQHSSTYGTPVSGGSIFNAIYPKHLLEELDPEDFWDWDFWTQPVGNGPYRYVSHEPQTMIDLEANPDYYRGRPRIDRVVLKFGSSAIPELLSGNVDAVASVDRMKLTALEGDRRFETYNDILFSSVTAIVWNHRRQFFQDKRVRRALTLAIDRPELQQVLNLPSDLSIFDVIFTDSQVRQGGLPAPLAHDPEEAARLLEEAGWRDVDGDGFRERAGDAFRFELLVSSGESRTAAVFIQDQFRRVGVQMEVIELDNHWERVLDADFDASILPVHPAGGLGHDVYFGSESVLGYNNSTVVGLLGEAAATLNPDEVDRIYRQLMPVFEEDIPITSLYPDVRTTVAHRRVRGLSSPYRAEPVWHVDDMWLEHEP
jgi:peptide/nickel transport system substrate-binding protein